MRVLRTAWMTGALWAGYLLLPAGMAEAASTSGPTPVAGFTHVQTLGGIEEYRLHAEGLAALLDPPPRALDVQGNGGVQRPEGKWRQAVPRPRRGAVQCHDIRRSNQLLRNC